MDDLISRKSAIRKVCGLYCGCEPQDCAVNECLPIKAIRDVPSFPAVPLDKLCEWLAVHSVNIPCETCRHFSNDYCTAIGDMDKPCPNKAEDWQRAIKEWMEGLDDHR